MVQNHIRYAKTIPSDGTKPYTIRQNEAKLWSFLNQQNLKAFTENTYTKNQNFEVTNYITKVIQIIEIEEVGSTGRLAEIEEILGNLELQILQTNPPIVSS